MAEEKVDAVSTDEAKEYKKLKVGYSVQQLTGGVEKAYLSTYSSYLYTNVFMLSAAYSGIMQIVSQIVGWIGGPLFGGIIDKVSFKKGRYWPWMFIGPTLLYGTWLLLYCLPAMGVRGPEAGIWCLILAIIASVVQPLATVPGNAVYPLLTTDPKERQSLAMIQKIGRDGGKTLFGYVFPWALTALAMAFSGGAAEATADGEAISYAICAAFACLIPMIGFYYYGFTLRGSYVERNAMAKEKNSAKKGPSIWTMLKTTFTNRPLLSMFLFMSVHKTYYFIYVTAATYMFRYVFGNFNLMGTFMTVFNLTAVVGAMIGPAWTKIFKESKRCFVSCMMVHVILLAVLAVTFKSLSPVMFIVIFGVSSLFMGMLENWILPYFAASSDYGAWKSGERMDGLTMSIYGLTIKTGTLFATTIRTAILVAANLDAVTAGGAVTAEFTNTMSLMYSWIPLILGVVALLILMFGVNLNDERIKWMNDDMKAGLTAATSSHKF